MSRYKSTNSSVKSHLSSGSLPKEEVNIVLVGQANVGKSALVVKYLTKRFICEYDPFLEDTYWKPDTVDQQDVLVKVMDTYGKDDKRLPYYLKWADAVLITYSITQQDSFEMALSYLDNIHEYSKSISLSSNELVITLIGNKLDLERNRIIAKADGETTASKFNCAFIETTAADDYEYVQNLFHRTVREVRKERERANNVTISSIQSLPTTFCPIEEEEKALPLPLAANVPTDPLSSSSSSSSSTLFNPLNNGQSIISSSPQTSTMTASFGQRPSSNVNSNSTSSGGTIPTNNSNTNMIPNNSPPIARSIPSASISSVTSSIVPASTTASQKSNSSAISTASTTTATNPATTRRTKSPKLQTDSQASTTTSASSSQKDNHHSSTPKRPPSKVPFLQKIFK